MIIGVIDTKACNLNSVLEALKRLDAQVLVSSSAADLQRVDKLILPGVGTAQAVMDGIERFKLRDFIVTTKKPLLGICLGMQVQGAASAEVPLNTSVSEIKTLGIIPDKVQKIDSHGQRLPHMGWNTVRHNDHPLFDGIAQDSYFYFVHSYCLPVGAATIGTTTYGMDFSAAIARDNFMGVQFHPEKSGAVGSKLLANFLTL